MLVGPLPPLKPLPRVRDARRGRLSPERQRAVVDALVVTIKAEREAGRILTPLNLEGLFRATLRATLCRQGWNWTAADDVARGLIERAFSRLGTMRPSWNEGQPDWAINTGTLIERTRCVRCKGPLPEDNHKYCSDLCRGAHHKYLTAIREADAETVFAKVVNFTGGVSGYET